MFTITDTSWSNAFLLMWSLGLATVGALALYVLASLFPVIAMPLAAKLLRNDDEICQVINQRYDVTDCTTPHMRHNTKEKITKKALAPLVARRKHR